MKNFFQVVRWIALCSILLFVFFSVQTVSSASLKGDQSPTAQNLNGIQSDTHPVADKVSTLPAASTTIQPRVKSLSRRTRIHYRIG
ncbi:hypothetical protein GHT06_013110 [Daphnia sinensis]|uniref:Uncharacterized protein n=1 Tax=Daphnia sinensis TaxID=1820382 RepID=A0AAD5LHJ6_9CRUS|nr:hypothetical protein GHT06_013110 [Daphnia sinensis]